MAASDDVRNFMGYLWVRQEDGVVTIGINEDGLEDFEEISSVELPAEQEKIDADVVIGTLETDDGPLDIYSPVAGTVIEINSQVIEDPPSSWKILWKRDGWFALRRKKTLMTKMKMRTMKTTMTRMMIT